VALANSPFSHRGWMIWSMARTRMAPNPRAARWIVCASGTQPVSLTTEEFEERKAFSNATRPGASSAPDKRPDALAFLQAYPLPRSASHVMETWRSHPFLGALIPAPTARPEKLRIVPRTPSFCLDPEARRLHSPLGVPVRSATACDERPCRLNQILKAGAKTVASAHVLHHCGAARPAGERAALRRALRRIRDAIEHETAHSTVSKAPLRNGNACALARTSEISGARRRARRSASAEDRAHRARLAREQPQAPSSAAAEVQRAPRAPAQATRASGASPATLRRHTSRRRSMDLLDATHSCAY